VVAYYLAAALAEAPARAVPGLHVTQVLTQRAAFGEPLDDVIVNGILEDGRPTKLSLQVKSTLTFTENDVEWIAVLGQAWATFMSGTFNAAQDRLGIAISSYNARADKYYQSVLSWAAHSPNGHNFAQRIMRKDFSHKDQRAFVAATRKILSSHARMAVDNDALWRFLSVFRILHFDFDTGDTSRDAAGALDRIRHCLPIEQRGQAAAIWTHLIAEAGEITPAGGGASRESLAARLQNAGLPSGSGATFWRDIQAIAQESKRACASIKGDIHGLRLNRTVAYEQVQEALRTARFVQIDGEPGSGKSALLKQLAEEAAQFGAVFLLKDSRIQPRGWAAHAGQLGLSGDLIGLMSELGTIAESILFIDGIDKVNDPASQLTVNDLVRAVASESALASWKILVTVREQNLDHIATWLDPDALRRLPVRSVTMSPLSSDELSVVSAEFPRLRPLLLEPGNTDVILRRPFFLEAILSLSGRERTTSLPATEVELFQLWWELGGADQPSFTPAQHRRNVLISLAERLIEAPNSAISIRDLPPEPLEDLKSAGVVRDKQLGHSVTFTHDIFEEWALCEWLVGKLPNIPSALKASKEPQGLIRPVQLLGSYELETNSTETEWQRLYEELADDSLRPVWQRAVLTSCLRSTRTTEILGKLASYLHQNNDDALKKLLNALQTLEVVPNTTFLDEAAIPNLEPEERVYLAHTAAWPKLLTWIRFLDWYLSHAGEPAPSLIPDILPVFSTWQSACAGQNIRHCQRIGEIAHGWLAEFEAALHAESFQDLRDPFGINFDRDVERDLEGAIRTLFLSSAGDVTDLVAAYLDAKAKDRLRHMYREKILAASATIARSLPKQLVDYIIAGFFVHPKDSERQRGYSSLLNDELGIEGHQSFYPASPYQPPFLLLLRQHEDEGLRLVKAICNHSVDVWQWLRQHPDYHREAVTPLPVEIEFPWGRQVFWGDGQVYLWFRGFWGNDASKCALMALEFWAFERIVAGDDFAEVLRKVLEGNDSVAALGLAVSLCLAYPDKSIEQVLPLVTCPQIWNWDLARSVQDRTSMLANEIGDWQRYRHMLNAVRELNRKPHRQACIRDIVPYFVFWHDASLKERYTAGIRSFTDRLPFEYAEERSDEAREAYLRKSMSWYMEQADPQFWHSGPTEDGKHIKLWNEPPSANSQERVQLLENHSQLNRYLRLALWAQRSLDGDKLDDGVTLAEALAEAQDLDTETLFDDAEGAFEDGQRRAAVAGVAYMLARFAGDDLWDDTTATWTIGTLLRASAFQAFDDLTFRGSILSMHPLIFAVHGFAALMQRGYGIDQCQSALLRFAVHPLETVVEAVATSANLYAAKNAQFYWVLFGLFVRQCIVDKDALPNYHSLQWDDAEATRILALLKAAEATLATGIDSPLPAVPLPWEEREDKDFEEDTEAFGFIRNQRCFQWHIAERTILKANLDVLMATPEQRAQFVTLVEQLVAMTIQDVVPPFAKSRRDNRGNTPFEWVFSFFHWLGKVASHLSSAEVQRIALAPLFATDNETALLAMRSFAPSYLAHSLLPPAVVTDEAFATWEIIAGWIIENPEARIRGRHVDREFSVCVFSLLFCFAGDFQPLVCVVEEEWSPLARFGPIIERVVRKFGTNSHLYLGVLRFLKKGGMDMIPDPGLSWLREIASAKKQDRDFWRANGGETVEILKLILTKKALSLSTAHRDTISFLTDILVDNGVRGAGFLQQDQLRQ
jgi:ABC-type cobalamin/Fe3+-siderophores transport system ATPase subunit